MGRETDSWPFVQAKFFTAVPHDTPRRVKRIVVHDMEYPEKMTAAEDVAKYFQNPRDDAGKPVKASSHICVDADSIVQCVRDRDIAYAAPGANSTGIQIELAGYGRQTEAEWLDAYGIKLLDNAANAIAQYCVKFDLPPVHLTDDQLEDDEPGIIGHVQATRVFHGSDHTDPGPNFPWQYLMERVVAYYAARTSGS